MKTKTRVNAGTWSNHNETIFSGLRVKTAVKAGDPAVPLALTVNHNETLARGLRVKTAVKAGDPAVPLALTVNHNETLRAGWSVQDQSVGVKIEPTQPETVAASLRAQTCLLAGKSPCPVFPCV